MKHIKAFENYDTEEKYKLPYLYHGTKHRCDNGFDLKFFNRGSGDGGYLGRGIYFTNDYDYAKQYAVGDDAFIYTVEVLVKNPLIVEDEEYVIFPMLAREYGAKNSKELTQMPIDEGYDAVIVQHKERNHRWRKMFYEVCVFDTSTIKILDREYIYPEEQED